MNLNGKQVTILGAGITGLEAAKHLAVSGIEVVMLERTSQPGGQAAALSCKAVDGCVRCGACMVQERLKEIMRFPNIRIISDARVAQIARQYGFTITCESNKGVSTTHSDAVLVSTGFQAYDPSAKPYGYGYIPDVITTLEAEALLKRHGKIQRPSNNQEPKSIAFIQCVGSRDSRLNHPWCSKICCGSSLRMARLIQHRQPGTLATFFYIDVQTFGKNFQHYYNESKNTIQMIRAIPGDIFKTSDNQMLAAFFDPQTQKAGEAVFDLVILAVGLTPAKENVELARLLDFPLTPWGFWRSHRDGATGRAKGIFTAGAALGPMSIPECIDSAGQAAWDIVQFLGTT